MKNTGLFLTIVAAGLASLASHAQENDDMYFNSKDRAKLNEKKISADLGLGRKNNAGPQKTIPINPTDSYSARNVNPEYSAQLKEGSAPVIEDNYFIADYQPKSVNQNLSNCNCSSGSFYNPYYGNSAFNNPYYGYSSGFGSPWSNYYSSPWGNPYSSFNSGWNMSLGYGWGNMNPMWYNSLGYGYGSFWNSYYNPWQSNYWGGYYPGQVVVIRNSDYARPYVQSKRVSRSSTLNNNVEYSRSGSTTVAGTGTSRSSVSGGRTRTNPEYYDRSWKRNQEPGTTRSYWSNSNSSGSSNGSRSYSNWNNTGGRQGSSGFSTPSRSTFNSGGSFSGGSRSGSSSGGSSGGSRSRGRNN